MLITGLCRSWLLPYVALAQRLENASCTGQRSEQPSRPDCGPLPDFREHGYLVASLADYGAWPPGYRRGRFPVDQVRPPALVDPVSTERFGDGSRYIGPRSRPGGTGDHVVLAAHRVIDGDGHTKRRSFAPVTGLHRSHYQDPPGFTCPPRGVLAIVRGLGADRRASPAGPTPCRDPVGVPHLPHPQPSRDSRHEPPSDESVPVERRLLASGLRRCRISDRWLVARGPGGVLEARREQ